MKPVLRLIMRVAAFAVLSASVVQSVPVLAQDDDQPASGPTGVFEYLLDRKSTWKEDAVDTLPPLPEQANLLPYEVSARTPLTFMIDAKSISIGKDGVIRYTTVISSPGGAHNIRYEGIRCETYTWRLYSGADSDGTAWDHASTDWVRIENSDLNAYHAALYTDYFCANKLPAGSARTIVQNIRYHRTADMTINGPGR